MYEIRNDIKEEIRIRGKKISNLSRELSLNYDTLGAYLNGRKTIPTKIEKRIKEVFEKWDSN